MGFGGHAGRGALGYGSVPPTLQLNPPTDDAGPTTLSVGAVGREAQGDTSYAPREGDFVIPSERSFRDGAGFLLHVPLGNITVR